MRANERRERARCHAVLSAVDVLLKAVGDTPIMRTKKWAVERTRTIQGLVDFIKKFLKLMASEQLVWAGTGRGLGVEGPRCQTLQRHCWDPGYSCLSETWRRSTERAIRSRPQDVM